MVAALVLADPYLFLSSNSFAQEIDSSFHQYSGKHINLITDVAPSPEIRELTAAFDAGVQHWTSLFHADVSKVATWKVKAYIMTERQRFENAGLVSSTIRTFREGHQEGDLIFCKEQPSAYYRRHLLLHEGVHWFMEKALGGCGPGWWMEGIAEWQSTHSWDGKSLVCGLMPKTREQVPYWGRFEWITQDIAADEAPSLPVLFQRAKDLHRVDSTYGWSWLAATFFANHPRYKDQFYKRLSQPTDYSNQLNKDVMSWIGDDLQTVQKEFNGFVTEMDYGVDPVTVIVDLKASMHLRSAEVPDELQIESKSGWHVFPRLLSSNSLYDIRADGLVSLELESDKLETTPDGITLRYVHGRPLGQLIGTLVPKTTSLEKTVLWGRISVGQKSVLQPETDSWLLLRYNANNASSAPPSGSFHVSIQSGR